MHYNQRGHFCSVFIFLWHFPVATTIWWKATDWQRASNKCSIMDQQSKQRGQSLSGTHTPDTSHTPTPLNNAISRIKAPPLQREQRERAWMAPRPSSLYKDSGILLFWATLHRNLQVILAFFHPSKLMKKVLFYPGGASEVWPVSTV